MAILAQFFGYILGQIYGFVQDYGISIIIFTLLTKLLLMPITIKQLKSSREMAALQPKIKALQEKYKNDKEKQSQMMMELYKEHNYNPLSGCLPLLIQMPIIIGLFTALRQPENYVFASDPDLLISATHDTFLWIKNLAEPDLMSNLFSTGPAWLLGLPGLMPILSAALTYFQMSSMNSMQGDVAQNSSMKTMQLILPAMILFWGTSMSAGLILYWTVGNIFQIIQQYIMKRPIKGEAQ